MELREPGSRPIEDYALIGSTHSAALIHRGGEIEWMCLPRFDSGAMFASLLGDRGNGSWALHAIDPEARVTRRYLPGTVVLETTIETATGCAVVIDFLPRPTRDSNHEAMRIVRGVRGEVAMHTEMRIRFNYGEWCPWVGRHDGAIIAVAGPDAVRIRSDVPLKNDHFCTHADFGIRAGEERFFCVEWYPSHETPAAAREPDALLELSLVEWRAWSESSVYRGGYGESVDRSLLTLRALTYAPTGGIVAAPTTSLPEEIGGVRNWDYRFCWLRDAALTLYALIRSGHAEEASAWRWWLMRAVGGTPDELQIMYGLHGERNLTEVEVDWLAGYECSKPVRIGNGAHGQRQLDVYGAVIGAFHASRVAGLDDMDQVWHLECAIARKLAVLWKEPDSSLWEVRGDLRHYVHSKVMCWYAFDRMIASAEQFGLDGPVDDWKALCREIHAEVCDRGFDAASNSFIQSYDGDETDAALLTLPLLGFLPADDPRIKGTVARIERDLMRNGLLLRYRTEGGLDGLAGDEGAFLACTFWLVDTYVAMGRQQEAVVLFEHLLSLANDLGLLAEEYDPVAKRQLGNFPQAFSHVGLINSAYAIANAQVIGLSGTASYRTSSS